MMVGKENTYSHATEGWGIKMYAESSTIRSQEENLQKFGLWESQMFDECLNTLTKCLY